MKCDKCQNNIIAGEEREHLGQTLCEDCYMDVLSPPQACDPWAVYTAKGLQKNGETEPLTETQQKILDLLAETGGLEPPDLARRLGLSPKELTRELATLRHMEKTRGEKRNGKIFIRLW